MNYYTGEQIGELIKSCYEKRTPLSLVRIGDGELMLLNPKTDKTLLEKYYRKQIGHFPFETHQEIIRYSLIEAINNCDAIGVPHDKTESGGYYTTWKEVMDEVSYSWHKGVNTTCDIHYWLLESGFLDTLLSQVPVLNYIGCRNLDIELKEKFGINIIRSYIVAPEMQFEVGYTGQKHWPDQFLEVRQGIMSRDFTGQICLVGAGFIGKSYCNMFRQRGGLAIDIGSVFDLWAGKRTRGKGKGVNVADLRYKL